ncbi:MAG: ATPase, T2SS/T4P/T4SS family [Candidatus Delongbacteria bacterium]|jgi:type IV pilus assembly protein PilB|nr:ATPase, T2SS/T4P/T4SS family [Candidatus Delongbacteria bacterium]
MLNAEIIDKDEEIVKFVNDLLEKAVKEGVSDVHIEPQATNTRVRFRKDGKLYIPEGYDNIPKQLHDYIIAQVKILTGTMNLDVKDQPQGGKIKKTIMDKEYVLRLLLYPTIHGESINIYKMDINMQDISIEDLCNNDDKLIEMFRRNINRKEGLILFTGPIGSGKSTFINTTIKELSGTDKKIRTVEPIVETQLENTDQFLLSDKLSMTGALRQACQGDVDVLYIGRMHNFEIAHIGLEIGSNDGYLVLSSMYTNNTPDTLFRFTDLGIKKDLTASALKFAIGIRLQEKLCPHCSEKADYSEKELKNIGLTDEDIKIGNFRKKVGCPKCYNKGYVGKVAIIEMLEYTPTIMKAFVNGADRDEIEKIAREEDVYRSFAEDTRVKFLNGDIDLVAARIFVLS